MNLGRKKAGFLLSTIIFYLFSATLGAASKQETNALELIHKVCEDFINGAENVTPAHISSPPEIEPIIVRGSEIGHRFFYQLSKNDTIRLDVIETADQPVRFVLELRTDTSPTLFIGMDSNCTVRQARRIVYQDSYALQLELLDQTLQTLDTAPLNPEPLHPGGESVDSAHLVAMVDSGVNYLLTEIDQHLARDAEGQLLSYDFWDLDTRPFDAHPAGSPFFVQRHGTRTASLLIREDPQADLISYRYPRPDMDRMSDLIRHADGLGVRIMGLPLGSNRLDDWTAFAEAAKAHSHILFIASAGNNGRDIDAEPVYPASMDIENMIVVTSAGDFVEPAERTNWGRESVDYLVPAERQKVIEFSGQAGSASGSSYAVSRMVALASRILRSEPGMDVQALIAAIDAIAVELADSRWARRGYIPDPLHRGMPPEFELLAQPRMLESVDGRALTLDVLQLDPRWQLQQVEAAVEAANKILSQCDIAISKLNLYRIDGPAYLQDLEVGSAHTVLKSFRALQTDEHNIALLLGRNSRMRTEFEAQAFGESNTTTRPWLRNTVWIMHGARDLPVTFAHELFHVLSDSGTHAPSARNLMSAQTSEQGTALTAAQCALTERYFR
ncbi:MAG: S8/S53 family peptidase [Gammaproteobacteria bacterium]